MNLVEFLMKNRNNKGMLAALRRGLVPASETAAWPYLARFGGVGNSHSARAVRTVAGLFAHHPENCAEGNFGDTCRKLCGEQEACGVVGTDGAPVPPGPMERKFEWLLASGTDNVCARVARVVLYAKSRGVAVNYASLERDLAGWANPRVRESWAKAFWSPFKKDEGGIAS